MSDTVSRDHKVSERNPAGINWWRLTLFILVIGGLDYKDALITNESLLKDWAIDFIVTNELQQQQQQQQHVTPVLTQSNHNHKKGKENSIYSEFRKEEKIQKTKSSNKNTTESKVLPTVPFSEESLLFLNPKTNNGLIHENKSDLFLVNQKLVSMNEKLKLANAINHQPLLQPASNKKKWYVLLAGGPQYNEGIKTYPSSLKYEKASQINNIHTNSGGTTIDHPNQSLALNVSLGYSVSKKWDVVTGVRFSFLSGSLTAYYDSEVAKNHVILTAAATNNADGTKSFTNKEQTVSYHNYFLDTLDANYKMSVVEIPLLVRYNWETEKWRLFINSGVSAVVNSNYTALYRANEIGTGEMNAQNKELIGARFIGGFGTEYKVTEQLSIHFSPEYSFGKATKTETVFENSFQSFSLLGGLRLNL